MVEKISIRYITALFYFSNFIIIIRYRRQCVAAVSGKLNSDRSLQLIINHSIILSFLSLYEYKIIIIVTLMKSEKRRLMFSALIAFISSLLPVVFAFRRRCRAATGALSLCQELIQTERIFLVLFELHGARARRGSIGTTELLVRNESGTK